MAANSERRLSIRVFREWLSIRRLQEYPLINQMSPRDFSVDWDSIYILRQEEDKRFNFEYIGKFYEIERPAAQGRIALGDIPQDTPLDEATRSAGLVIQHRTPILTSAFVRIDSASVRKLRCIALPFGDASGVLRYVVGVYSGRVFQEAETEPFFEYRQFRSGQWQDLPAVQPSVA